MMERPTRNLGFDLLRVTESAAMMAARWMGRGDKNEGDRAAVDAMRLMFGTVDFRGRVVIGEGEKDEAPMLYTGEELGTGNGPEMDIAVDPVEGTSLLANGRPNAIAVVGLAPRGSMMDPGRSYYMQKLVVPPGARTAVDLDAPVSDNLASIAKALGKQVDDLVVFVLDKPRHRSLVDEIRRAGARIQFHTDGDVNGALMAAQGNCGIDLMIGTGGTPEGILAAVAIKVIGGQILGRLDPQSEDERRHLEEAGFDLKRVYSVDDMVRSNDVYFAATGITDGPFLKGVRYESHFVVTHSMVMRGSTGSLRYIESHTDLDKLMQISALSYH